MYLYLKSLFFQYVNTNTNRNYQKISQIEIQIHKKKVFENTFQIQILFKYTSLIKINKCLKFLKPKSFWG